MNIVTRTIGLTIIGLLPLVVGVSLFYLAWQGIGDVGWLLVLIALSAIAVSYYLLKAARAAWVNNRPVEPREDILDEEETR